MRGMIHEIDAVEAYAGIFSPAGERPELQFRDESRNEKLVFNNGEKYSICFHLKKGINEKKFLSEQNNLAIFFHGEIYNYDELCNTCNVSGIDRGGLSYSGLCCVLFEKYGISFVSRINGFFSLVIMDLNNGTLYLAADRFASARPIYYHISNKIRFGSQLKRLLNFRDTENEIDEQGLAVFLKYSYIPSPVSIIKGIRKLGPGETLIFNENGQRLVRYNDFESAKQQVYSEKDAVERYIYLLGRSIARKMEGIDERRVGFFLSGGLDSSANVALACSNGSRKFNTFGIGFNDPELDERPYARIAAKHFGVSFYDNLFDGSEIEYLPEILWHMDEPFMENGLFLTYAGFKAAKDKVDLVIAGDGADQLFGTGGFAGGRPIAFRYLFEKCKLLNTVNSFLNVIHKNSYAYKDNFLFKVKVMLDRSTDFNNWFFWGFDDYELAKLCNFPLTENMLQCFQNDLSNNLKTFDDYYRYAILHQDIEHYICQNVVVKSFRMSELFRIKLREAYLDNDIIDFILNLNHNLLTKGSLVNFIKGDRKTKYLHRISMQKLLPDEILNKPKQGGLIPMSILFSNHKTRDLIFKYLLGSEIVRSYFDFSYIKQMMEEYLTMSDYKIYWSLHHDGRVNRIMNILTFSLWYDLCFRNNYTSAPDLTLSRIIR
jgi:asparagine synthase (glutamine-hydrolysing)